MPGLARSGSALRSGTCCLELCLALFLAMGTAFAAPQDQDLDLYSTNEMGGVGLLQTRTARFAPDGTLELGASFINPYRRYYINMQILPWLEANFRYTDITNRPQNGPVFDQSQRQFFGDLFNFRSGGTNLDRALDFKIKLFGETGSRPALALGIQDALGTGLFGGEYIVASKRFKRLDVHFGIGWGYLGNRGFLPNPFKALGGRFDQRDAETGRGGKVSLANFFAGKSIALFGGAEYITPIDGLSLKLEYSGTDPALEPNIGPLRESLPLALGLNFRPASWFDVSLGFERGNSLMLRTAFRTNLLSRGIKKNDLPQPNVVTRLPEGEIGLVRQSVDLSRTGKADLDALYAELNDLNLNITALEINLADARLSATGGASKPGWEITAASVMYRYLPPTISKVTVQSLDGKATSQGMVFTRSSIRFANEVDEGLAFSAAGEYDVTEIILHGRRLDIFIQGEDPQIGTQTVKTLAVSSALADVQEARLRQGSRVIVTADLLVARINQQAEDLFEGVESDGVVAREIRLADDGLQIYSADENSSTTSEVDFAERGPESDPERQKGRSLGRVARAIGLRQASLYNVKEGGSADRFPEDIARRIFSDLSTAGFTGYAVDIHDAAAEIFVSKTRYLQLPRNLGWVARISANHLPPEIDWITVVQMERGAEVSRITILRSDIERYDQRRGSPEEMWQHTKVEKTGNGPTNGADALFNERAYPETSWWLGPALLQHIGDPDTGIYLADVYARLGASFSPAPGWQISGEFRQFVVGNLDQIQRPSDSVLPRVRSDIVRYLQEGRSAVSRLQLDYITKLRPDLYARASAGLFESMFGGVGGEILYRPVDESWAVGADLNWVKQRNFNQLFGFQNYDVVTGHVDLYYDWPVYNLRSIISGGRYLAGDYGVTIDVSRRFESGVRVGAFATFTDVSAEDFGEGSFDKGFYLSIPLEALLPVSSRERSRILFRPLARDGGQRLSIGSRLFQFVDDANQPSIERDWGRVFE